MSWEVKNTEINIPKIKRIFIKILKIKTYIFISIFCANQIKNEIIHFNNRKIHFFVENISPKVYQLPKIIICPGVPFHPAKLEKLGLDTNSNDIFVLGKNYASLKGIDQNLTLKTFSENVSWKLGEIIKEVRFDDFYQKFDVNVSFGKYWKHEFYQVRSCFSFKPPPHKNINQSLIINFREIGETYFCRLPQNITLTLFISAKNCNETKPCMALKLDSISDDSQT